MLKGIDPRLNADVLHALRAMGHGDAVAVVDTKFPADSLARGTVTGRLLRMDNLSAAQAVEAILSVMPLDTFVDDFACHMKVVDRPDELPPALSEVQAAIDRAEGRARPMLGLERLAFYQATRGTYAVIQTGERRFYGNAILRKGATAPEAGR